MKTFLNITSILVLIAGLMMIGCRSSQMMTTEVPDLPGTFGGKFDSINSASMKWKDYFKDPLLIGLIDTALRSNHDLLMAFQRIERARSEVRTSKGAMLPSIYANVSAAQRKFGLYTMDGAGNITTPIDGEQMVPVHLPDYYTGIQTSWELDIWGKLKSRKAAALSRYMATEQARHWVVTNLISEIAAAYYELISLDLQLDIIKETVLLQENAFNIIQFQKQAGRVNELAVKQFEAQFVNSQTLEVEVKGEIVQTENRLNFLLGRYPQPIRRSDWVFATSVPFNLEVGVPSDLLRLRPDVKQAEFELLAAKADVSSARAAFLPSFNITGGYGFQAFKTAYLFLSPESTAYTLLGSLSAPLVNRSAIRAAYHNAKAAQIEAMYNYQKAVLNGFIEVNNELLSIRNLEALSSLKEKEARLLSESIDISSQLFKTGRANYLEVIVTQQRALQARIELVRVKKNQFDSAISLYKALGGGWQ